VPDCGVPTGGAVLDGAEPGNETEYKQVLILKAQAQPSYRPVHPCTKYFHD